MNLINSFRPLLCIPGVQYLTASFAPNGRIIVTVAQPARFARMLQMLRRNFEVTEEATFRGSERRLIILH
jgi:hypothetical protein